MQSLSSETTLSRFNIIGYEWIIFAPYALAAAYAANGQFDNAVETAQKALSLASSAGQNTVAANIQKRLTLYQNEQAYVETSQPP